MLKIFKKFFDFCGKVNKGKFYKSLALGVLFALMEAVKIPAIMLLLNGIIENKVTSVLLWQCFGILLLSVVIGSVIKYYITMLQCEAGYYTAAGKRVEIAEHMRYLPMGYFNQNSLGQITSVTTNTMEQLADVATGVVMMTTQGILTTLVITAMVLCFDWRIGLVAVVGILLFFGLNSVLQKRSQKLAPIKIASITLGGEDVRSYSMDSLMKNFSFVFQNVYLFQDTIANNIRFGQEDAPMEKVIEAAKKACCHDFIMALPDGYETVIGEGGASLSGGEKQRISIARAIMKDAPIIILDEATANVDPENEKELMEAIDALTKEKTIFMIAHRLKTVRNADRILVLDQGRIVQQGRHEELIQQEGMYKRFVESREMAASWKL